MTATIAWSLIWSVPEGVPFAGNGLMSASQPWSGHYSGGDGTGNATAAPSLDGPLWTTAHTTQFTAPGWRYLTVNSGGSGFLPASVGGGSYVTLVPAAGTADVTIVLEKFAGPCKCAPNGTNTTADGVVAFATAGGLPGPGATLQVWRTNATRQFWRDADVVIGADSTFSVFVASESMVTLSTVRSAAHGMPAAAPPPPAPFTSVLPYADDFSSYAEDTAPVRLFADQQGSFAARGGALRQVVELDPGVNRWVREDVDPVTLLGDASLVNVTLAVGVAFAPARNASGPGGDGFTYVQACARVAAYSGLRNGPPPGVCLAVNASGTWVARAGPAVLAVGALPGAFDAAAPHALVLAVDGPRARGWVLDGAAPSAAAGVPAAPPLFDLAAGAAPFADGGLVALGCGYHAAAFSNFSRAAAPPAAGTTRPAAGGPGLSRPLA
jgi:hypothetical protein